MKKLALASAAIGGAALVAFGASGTFANFTDSATQNVEAGAGTLVLNSAAPSGTPAAKAMALKPGESATFAYYVQNGGSMDAGLTALADVTDYEHGCSSNSEFAVDPTCGVDGDTGEFSSAATITGYRADAGESQCVSTVPVSDSQAFATAVPLSQAETGPFTLPALAAEKGQCIVVRIDLPNTNASQNKIQGDSAVLGITFTLTQA